MKIYVKVFLLIILLSITGCGHSDKRDIAHFDRFKIRENHYEGVLNEGSGKDYVKAKWHVNGEGRAISAMIQSDDGRIVQHRVWSYSNFIGWISRRNHKRMMLEALQWTVN